MSPSEKDKHCMIPFSRNLIILVKFIETEGVHGGYHGRSGENRLVFNGFRVSVLQEEVALKLTAQQCEPSYLH